MPDNESATTKGPPGEEARAILTALLATTEEGIICRDMRGCVTSWSAGAERVFGFTAAEVMGQTLDHLVPPDRIEEFHTLMADVRRGVRSARIDTVRLHKDQRRVPISQTISPIFDSAGQQLGFIAVFRDQTAVEKLTQDLQLREALARTILEIVPDGLIVIDPSGIVQSFSPPAERTFGYAAAEVIGRNVKMLMPPTQATSHDGYLRHYLRTGERRIIGVGRVVLAQRKDGSTFPMELQIGEITTAETHLFVGFIGDLTLRRDRERRVAELQSEVIHLSRVSDLGHLASAIAHELNQPLTAIGNYMSGARRMLDDNTPLLLRQAIERAAAQAERAGGIVKSLRALVTKGARPRQREELETLLHETYALAMIGRSQNIDLQIDVADDTRVVYIDKIQIQQVLLNLIRNALEAMGGQAVHRLAVLTRRQGDRVEVTVTDSGPGLPPALLDNVFLPFSTSKKDGLGVGLSICRMIIEAHGGSLIGENPVEGGARFRFTVPGPDAPDSEIEVPPGL